MSRGAFSTDSSSSTFSFQDRYFSQGSSPASDEALETADSFPSSGPFFQSSLHQQQQQQQQHSSFGPGVDLNNHRPYHPQSYHHQQSHQFAHPVHSSQPSPFDQQQQQAHSASAPVASSSSTGTNPPTTKLVKRNSFRLSKRISTSSLLPSNYTNKKKPLTTASSASASSHPSRTFSQDLGPTTTAPSSTSTLSNTSTRHRRARDSSWTAQFSIMALKDSIMLRKGYWLRNGAILLVGLTIFFYVMVPREPQAIHNKVNVKTTSDQLANSKLEPWPAHITSDHCTRAHPGRQLIQYVLMVDAGSTGSRIHVYKFNYCKAAPELEGEVFEHLKPGLSNYGDDPEAGARSLDPLLDLALRSVPKELHGCTPIAVKATAGLRALGMEKSEKILASVRYRLENKYPFPIIANEGVVVMGGTDEGVFAWVTVNYLLEKINSLDKKPTVAIMDLGGGSTQIVFEPKVVGGHSIAQGDHRYPMTFNGNDYTLFQHSYLGYGLMEARNQINNFVVANPVSDRHGIRLLPNEYAHPCVPVGEKLPFVTVEEEEVVLVGTSDAGGQCREVIEAIFYKEEQCNLAPCSFKGVYQPSIQDTFADNDIYAISYIFDRTAPFRLGEATTVQEMTMQELSDLMDLICKEDETGYPSFRNMSPEAHKELERNELCMDLSYIYGLLEYGYGIPKHRKLVLAKKIKNYETGWCLGASIAVLEESAWCSNAV